MTDETAPAIEAYYSYAPEDAALFRELEKHLASLLQKGLRGWASSDYPRSVATTWSVSFEQVEKESPLGEHGYVGTPLVGVRLSASGVRAFSA